MKNRPRSHHVLLLTLGALLALSSAPRTGSAARLDTLESTLTRTRDAILSQRKENQYWSGPFEMDASSDALVLALGKKIERLTPELQDSFVRSILSRITLEHQGWASYAGGGPDLNVTSIVLLCLRSIGIDSSDPRVAESWKWFESQGGESKLPPYSALLLSTVGLASNHQLPEISPRIFGLPPTAPIEIDRIGIPRGVVVPLIGLNYFSSLPDHALIVDRKSPDEWRTQPVEIGTFSLNRSGRRGQKKCTLPDTATEGFFEEVQLHRDEFKDCVFYPKETGIPLLNQLHHFFGESIEEQTIEFANYFTDHAITGSDVYWGEQALSWELQAQNPHQAWYGTYFSVIGIRFLQEAQRLGMGDFQPLIDQAWTSMLNWRVQNSHGILVQQMMLTGVWDTASILLAFNALQDTPWALSADQVSASKKWLLNHAIPTSKKGLAWSFDETDSSLPDVDDTANVIHALAEYATDDDPYSKEAIRQGSAWVLSQQNRDGGFPAWASGASPLVSDLVEKTLHIPAFADLSQADVTGRVLYSLAVSNPVAGSSADPGACQFLTQMPRVNGSSARLALGHWMVNYLYSAANVLEGITAAGCDRAEQFELGLFIVDRQQEDGGWGEAHSGYLTAEYVPQSSTLSQTAVALSGLISLYESTIQDPSQETTWLRISIERGIQFLITKSDGGRNLLEDDFTGVLVKGLAYARYEILPAYTTLNVLGRWEKILSVRPASP